MYLPTDRHQEERISQRMEIHVLHRRMHHIVAIALIRAGSPGGLAHMEPIGGLIAGPPEAVLWHESLLQMKGMAVAALPVLVDPPGNLRQQMAGQVGNPHPVQRTQTGASLCARDDGVAWSADPLLGDCKSARFALRQAAPRDIWVTSANRARQSPSGSVVCGAIEMGGWKSGSDPERKRQQEPSASERAP
jgi:hypothetical protein